MKLLVIGSGGREHALAWRLQYTAGLQHIYVAPGNAGTAREPGVTNLPLTDIQALAAFAKRENIHATIVGPEAPLAAGIVDVFREQGLRIFGPSQAAAQLESSKDFAKQFMVRHGIPTAASQTFTATSADIAAAHAYINKKGAPIVVKADGLAAGKGVVVAMNLTEAHEAVDNMLAGNTLGEAGARVLIEEFLDGEEASFIVMADGKHALALATSQDHKRLGDADTGPNTGGMGAYSPAPVVTPEIHARVMREVIMPTINGMAADGIIYTGFLYAGLMIRPDGSLRVLEFNCRMGDPETQPIMMRLKTDLITLVDAAIDGRLDQVDVEWDRRVALGIVMAAANYPATPRQGDVIHGLAVSETSTAVAKNPTSHVFHAGTKNVDEQIITAGGRVLCVTALGDGIKEAQKNAYAALAPIHFDGMQYRHDIGFRALKR
ncbi:MAG: phosphoribosylamine--glycine ligase [Rhodocyclales bacterium]|jgi:phosphoribosylamine--glycine ligase|nr:phosphoribosylamine--glycine ligase [Rhodocyclales bacterium]MBH1975847.1 phosphoribosylamine--glycine ligase [Rhodocyclales bacterium]MBT9460793.1 phosphoribosylamine--glycine ligase [Rugosibacter sp.]